MKVSILIANYNNGKFLHQALDSVKQQTYENWEVIIVDDASNDSSVSVYNQFQGDKRIKVFYNPENRGCGFTKRRCIDLAEGDLCAFLDPDDTIEADSLSIMVKAHFNLPLYSIIYSNLTFCDENLRPIKVSLYNCAIPDGESHLSYMGGGISHFAVFKKALYDQTIGIDETLISAVDQDLYYKLEETGPVHFINQPLYNYRQHSGSISLFSNSLQAHDNHLKVIGLAIKRREGKTSAKNMELKLYFTLQMQHYQRCSYYKLKKNKNIEACSLAIKALKFLRYDRDLVSLKLLYSSAKSLFLSLFSKNIHNK
ncbi:glycosyltransferase family 2 protein [Pontibacter sp. 13R65]|uniref:glycosyltransferase family 2 protein n=1 Tax=Pontibacter sp. 13R65 TaxID=3127458 RepID=UPI00301C1BC9